MFKYSRVPNYPEDSLSGNNNSSKRSSSSSTHRFRFLGSRPKTFLVSIAILSGLFVILFFRPFGNRSESGAKVALEKEKDRPESPPPSSPSKSLEWIQTFDVESRPSWMDAPPPQVPLILRVAVMSHPKEVQRRQIIRDYIFKGVRPTEVEIDYRFMVGSPDGSLDALQREHEEHKDLVILDFKDELDRLSQKRFLALKWVCNTSLYSSYFFTVRLPRRPIPCQMQATTTS